MTQWPNVPMYLCPQGVPGLVIMQNNWSFHTRFSTPGEDFDLSLNPDIWASCWWTFFDAKSTVSFPGRDNLFSCLKASCASGSSSSRGIYGLAFCRLHFWQMHQWTERFLSYGFCAFVFAASFALFNALFWWWTLPSCTNLNNCKISILNWDEFPKGTRFIWSWALLGYWHSPPCYPG